MNSFLKRHGLSAVQERVGVALLDILRRGAVVLVLVVEAPPRLEAGRLAGTLRTSSASPSRLRTSMRSAEAWS